jgi:hypothetical protein
MTNLERFEAWARENGRLASLADAQDYCNEVNLATLQATIAQRAQATKTPEDIEADARWASLEGNF